MPAHTRVKVGHDFQNCRMSHAKRTFSETSFVTVTAPPPKMAKLHRAFCNFWKSVGKLLRHFYHVNSCTRLRASSGLFLFLQCNFKNTQNVWSIRIFLTPPPTEASKLPPSENHCNLQYKMAIRAKTHEFLIVFKPLVFGLLPAPSRPPSWLRHPFWLKPFGTPPRPPGTPSRNPPKQFLQNAFICQ